MSLISIITWIGANLGTVISIITEIAKLIGGLPMSKRKAAMANLAAAVHEARRKNSTDAIVEWHRAHYCRQDDIQD